MNNITTLNVTGNTYSDYIQIAMIIPIFAAILLIILCKNRKDICIKKYKITPYNNTVE